MSDGLLTLTQSLRTFSVRPPAPGDLGGGVKSTLSCPRALVERMTGPFMDPTPADGVEAERFYLKCRECLQIPMFAERKLNGHQEKQRLTATPELGMRSARSLLQKKLRSTVDPELNKFAAGCLPLISSPPEVTDKRTLRRVRPAGSDPVSNHGMFASVRLATGLGRQLCRLGPAKIPRLRSDIQT